MPSRETLPRRIAEFLIATPEEKTLIDDAPRRRMERCARLYFALLNDPRINDRQLREMDKQLGARGTIMYEDVRAVKTLVGDLDQTTRAAEEWLFRTRSEEIYELARAQGDLRTMTAVNSARARYMRLDKEEAREADFRAIGVQRFEVVTEYKPLTRDEERDLFRQAEIIEQSEQSETADE